MPLRWRTTVLLVLAACFHELPPEPGESRVDTIPDAGPPERLTLNAGKDATPAFTADGRGIWYAWERLDRPDHDLCLGLLPLTGGTRAAEVCHTTAGANPDSSNWYSYPAPHPDGRRIAWLRISALASTREGGRGEVVLGSIDQITDPSRLVRLSIFPFQVAPGSILHFHVQPIALQWANDSTMIYVGTLFTAFQANGLAVDTFFSGRELGTITLTGIGGRSGFVPGTDSASGVTVAPDGSLYFTRNGDARVFRTSLAGNVIDTVFDFGPAGIARDPVYVDGAIYAVVGGDVSYYPYPGNVGVLQHDGGGQLWRVDGLGPTLVDSSRRWRRPARSPDGHTLVVEGRDPTSGVTDLFLLRIN